MIFRMFDVSLGVLCEKKSREETDYLIFTVFLDQQHFSEPLLLSASGTGREAGTLMAVTTLSCALTRLTTHNTSIL